MILADLVGLHQLSGVDTGNMRVENMWGEQENCQFVKFTLDGVHYMAVEDPDDGYRSRCRELVTSETPPRFSFPPQSVVCSMKGPDTELHENNDILVVKDCITEEIVLEVGTANYDDWYPYCHFEYHPENMACNDPEISEERFNAVIMMQSR